MFNTPLSKEDKWSAFGHYTVDSDLDTPIFSLKIALEKQRAGQGWARFRFHDQLFAAAQPTLEPTEDLLSLYVQRVQQLRNKYDHLVLLYSGGADSHNILKCFEHSGTKLDEIVSFVDSSYKGRDSKISSEIYRVAVPEVTEYLQKFPECEYRLLEMREIQTKLFNDPAFKFDHYQDTSYHLIPFALMHYYGLNYIDLYHKLHNAGKRVGVIHGIDKVKLEVIDNRWCFCFNDWSSSFGQKHFFRDFPTYDEFFYWTPEMPQLTVKQAHVASRYFDYLDSIGAETKFRDNQLANVVVRKSGTVTNWDYANHAVYPFWKTGTFSTGKTFESFIANGRDDTLVRAGDELMRPYRRSVVKTLALAKQTGRHISPKGIRSDTTDGNSVIGLAPLRTVRHFIE